MGGSLKWTLLLAAVLLSAACLAACGGDSSDTTASSPSSGESSQATGESPAQSAPPRGKVSARSAEFQKYSGGDSVTELHLAEFGTEGSDSDRKAVQSTIDAYLAASESGEWERACGYVSQVLKSQIDEIAEQAKQATPPTCGEILRLLVAQAEQQTGESSISAPEGIASLRIKEGPGGGFALFHGSDGKDHWMAVKREGEGWTVLSSNPQSFPNYR